VAQKNAFSQKRSSRCCRKFKSEPVTKGRAIKVIRKVPWLGGEFGQFDPDSARNQQQGLNILQTKLRGSETGFCTKISFVPIFPFS